MKSVLKQSVVALFALTLITPAFAAEGSATMTKGGKSYQSAKSAPEAQATQAETANAEDVSQIAPAAGDQTPAEQPGQSLKEDLRLPRKN